MTEEAVATESTESNEIASTESEATTEESSEVESEGEATAEQSDVEQTEESTEAVEEPVAPQLYETVIDGVVQQVSLDDLVSNYQLKQASNKRFQEAAAKAKQAEELQSKVLQNPIQALVDAGASEADVKKYVYELAHTFLQQDEMPEEERKALELQQREEAIRQQEEDTKKKAEERTFLEQQRAAAESYQKQFSEALQTDNMPSEPEDLAAIAQIMADNIQHGLELSVQDAVGIYKETQQTRLGKFFKSLQGEQLLGLLGEDIISEIRKQDVAKIKNPEPKSKQVPKDNKSTPKKEVQSMEDFLDSLK